MKRYVAVLALLGVVAGCGDNSRITGSPVQPEHPVLTAEVMNSVSTARPSCVPVVRGDGYPMNETTGWARPFSAVATWTWPS